MSPLGRAAVGASGFKKSEAQIAHSSNHVGQDQVAA